MPEGAQAEGGALRNLTSLDASLLAGTVGSLLATGNPCRIAWHTDQQQIDGEAVRIESADGRRFFVRQRNETTQAGALVLGRGGCGGGSFDLG